MGVSPAPIFPEWPTNIFERKVGPNQPGQRGPLRFEEGVATDTDIPDDYQRGMIEGAVGSPGRPNHVDPSVQYKHADETLQERAHVGSASWIEAPTFLSEFAHGSFSDYAEQTFEEVFRDGGHQDRVGPNVVPE